MYGADLLADVAAEDPVAEVRSQLARDRAALLDRLKRDARWRVDRVRGDDRARRAAIETDAAASAVLGQWLVGLEVEIEQQLAEHDPGAVPGHDDAGVLAVPAEPGAGGDRAIDDPGMVGQEPGRNGLSAISSIATCSARIRSWRI